MTKFTDLSLSVAGLPITIGRTYDTLQANKVGDFGHGWNLDLFNMGVRTDVNVGDSDLADMGLLAPYRHGTRLHVRLPGGAVESFTVTVEPLQGSFGAGLFLSAMLNIYNLRIVPDPGNTSTLALSLNPQVFLNEYGELTTGDGLPFNPASPYLDIDYIYTTADGATFRLSGNTGALQTIQDRQGNTLSVSPSGITSTAPDGTVITSITFTRDHLGRITSITDPAGQSITYTYDTNGDLVAVTDRSSGGGATTRFEYDPEVSGNRPHFLTSIYNAEDVRVLHTQFDPDTGQTVQPCRRLRCRHPL